MYIYCINNQVNSKCKQKGCVIKIKAQDWNLLTVINFVLHQSVFIMIN